MKYAFYAVDRIEGNVAVLFGDHGETAEIPLLELPDNLREGSVLRVQFGARNQPDWSKAVLDERERKRRLDEMNRQLQDLQRSDPGGDIAL